MKWITPLVALTSLRNTLAPFTASRLSVKKKIQISVCYDAINRGAPTYCGDLGAERSASVFRCPSVKLTPGRPPCPESSASPVLRGTTAALSRQSGHIRPFCHLSLAITAVYYNAALTLRPDNSDDGKTITPAHEQMTGLTVECRVVVQQSQLLVLSDLQEGLSGG